MCSVETLTPIDRIPQEAGALMAALIDRDTVIDGLRTKVEDLREIMAQMQSRLEKLLRDRFGASSERWCPGQLQMFTETASMPLPPPPPTDRIEGYDRKRKGRPALPDNLPRERREYELTADQQAEFDRTIRIGEEVSSTLDYTPPRLVVVDHVRGKYRCEKDGTATIRTAFAQPSPLLKSNASAGLLAHVVVSKFLDGLPLYRIERQFERYGLALSRNTMSGWIVRLTPLLEALHAALRDHLLSAPVIFGDDTPHDLLEEGRGSTVTARLWAYISCGQFQQPDGTWTQYPRAAYYEYSATREARHPLKLLQKYSGYLQADDYSGWNPLLKAGRILHVACNAHARRRFFAIACKEKDHPGAATEALAYIKSLYAIEKRIRDADPPTRARIRQEEAVPILEQYKIWLDALAPQVLPKSPLGKAIHYTLSNWAALTRYTSDGMLSIDSNLVERGIRTVAIARKAYLFFGAESGARAAAIFYSLIETCRLNDIEPYAYLKDVLERIGSHSTARLAELLPFNWKPQPS
jgi:transposase